MVRNPALVEAFEKSQIRSAVPDFNRNLKIVEELYREACLLGAWPLKNPLEGIEGEIHLARVINVRTSA